MNLIRKILCKFNFHDEELFPVEIRPVIHSRWDHLNKIVLPTYNSFMWVCKHCKREKVIYK